MRRGGEHTASYTRWQASKDLDLRWVQTSCEHRAPKSSTDAIEAEGSQRSLSLAVPSIWHGELGDPGEFGVASSRGERLG